MRSSCSLLNRVVLIAILGALPSCGNADEDVRPSTVSCFEPSGESEPAFLDQRVNVSFKEGSLINAIKSLNEDLGLPVSFIEGEDAGSPFELKADGMSVREILREMMSDSPEYRCAIVDDRVVIFGEVAGIHEKIQNVDIVNIPRARASRAYLKKVAKEVTALSDLDFLFGGIVDSPTFGDQVTLTREATVLEHLVQLLGKDEDVYFWIRRASTGSRYLTLGSVPSAPGGDMGRVQR